MKRESFGSRLGFLLVSAGCAIGIGNVWRFPYITGQNGGGYFVLVYLICLVVMGIPVLTMELAVGRASRQSAVLGYKALEKPGSKWHIHGWFCMAGCVLLMMYYTTVSGWMVSYFGKFLTGAFHSGMSTDEVASAFGAMLSSPGEMALWAEVVVVAGFLVCSFGLQKGLERVTKVMMLCLLVLILVLAVHSLTLSGAAEGMKFYLVPSMDSIRENGFGSLVTDAMNQAFFTLSLGIAAMEIFGSYLDKSRRLTGEALSVMGLDTFVALMAGIIIIPACFAYGVQPDSGPSLLFITLPNVFNHMAGGRIWGTAFFIFMTFAALSTVIAVFENILSMTMEIFGWDRKKAVKRNIVLVILLSMPAVLGYNVLSGMQPIGAGSTIMDLEDFLVSYNLLPLGSLLAVLFCTKKNGWGWKNFLEEVDAGEGIRYPKVVYPYVRFGVPLLIIIIYIKGYYDMFAPFGTKTLVFWMCVAAAFLALIFSFTTFNRKKQ